VADILKSRAYQTHFSYRLPVGPSATRRPVPYALLASITTPEHPAQHNTDYTYDGLGRVEAVADAVAIQKGGRGPYQFFLADGTRGERDDPLGQPYALVSGRPASRGRIRSASR